MGLILGILVLLFVREVYHWLFVTLAVAFLIFLGLCFFIELKNKELDFKKAFMIILYAVITVWLLL